MSLADEVVRVERIQGAQHSRRFVIDLNKVRNRQNIEIDDFIDNDGHRHIRVRGQGEPRFLQDIVLDRRDAPMQIVLEGGPEANQGTITVRKDHGHRQAHEIGELRITNPTNQRISAFTGNDVTRIDLEERASQPENQQRLTRAQEGARRQEGIGVHREGLNDIRGQQRDAAHAMRDRMHAVRDAFAEAMQMQQQIMRDAHRFAMQQANVVGMQAMQFCRSCGMHPRMAYAYACNAAQQVYMQTGQQYVAMAQSQMDPNQLMAMGMGGAQQPPPAMYGPSGNSGMGTGVRGGLTMQGGGNTYGYGTMPSGPAPGPAGYGPGPLTPPAPTGPNGYGPAGVTPPPQPTNSGYGAGTINGYQVVTVATGDNVSPTGPNGGGNNRGAPRYI